MHAIKTTNNAGFFLEIPSCHKIKKKKFKKTVNKKNNESQTN